MSRIEDCQKIIKVFAANRDRPLSAEDVMQLSGETNYFTVCRICEDLIQLGLVDVARKSDSGLVKEAIFAVELSGENLDAVVEHFIEESDLLASQKKRICQLEGLLSTIQAALNKSKEQKP